MVSTTTSVPARGHAAAPARPAPAPRPRSPKDSLGTKVFSVLNTVFMLLLCAVMLYPFLTVLAQSFSSPGAIRAGRVNLVPVGFNVDTYVAVLTNATFWRNYGNTVLYTVLGTALAMLLTTTYAYVLSKKHLKGRGVLIGVAVFTMFFNGGIVPNYVLLSSLGMKDTMWAVIVPGALSVFNLLVMKSFFENLPVELEEAAQIDGLGWYSIFLRIVLPLSKAVIATMVLFYSVQYWNDWFGAFLYLTKTELFPITLYLRNLIAGASNAASEGAAAAGSTSTALGANIQAVTMILTVLPILCVYPFVQRYFVTGVMLGSVKG